MENRDRDERRDAQGQGGREQTGQNPGKGQGGRDPGTPGKNMPGKNDPDRQSGRPGQWEEEQDEGSGTRNPSGDRTGQTPRTG